MRRPARAPQYIPPPGRAGGSATMSPRGP